MAIDTRFGVVVSETSPSDSSSAWEGVEAFACRVEAHIERRTLAWTAALSLLYLGMVLPLSYVRLLWFDELLTFWFCRFNSLSHLWWMLKGPVEGIPPLFYLITRGSEALFGENATALRVPGMVGYWVMSVAIYKFARKHTSSVFALLATMFPCVTFAYYYACEARPYGMVLGCSALLLLFWREAVEASGRRRALAAAAIGVTMAFAVSIHYYAVFISLPIAAGELVRLVERRKPDWLVWIAGAAGASVQLGYIPLIRTFMGIHKSPYEWNKPQMEFIWRSYATILGATLLPVGIVLVWLFVSWKGRDALGKPLLPRHEMAACVTLALLPLLGYAAARTFIGMLSERYVIETVIGFSLLFGLGTAKVSRNRRSIGLALLSLVLVGFIVLQCQNVHREYVVRNRYHQFDSAAVARSFNLPVTTGDTCGMLALDYYGPREFTSRFVIAVDPDIARHYDIPDTDHNIYLGGKGILPIRVERFPDFLEHNDQFLIFGGPVGWMEDYVLKRGARVQIVLQTEKELLLLVTQHPAAAQTAGARPLPVRGTGSFSDALAMSKVH